RVITHLRGKLGLSSASSSLEPASSNGSGRKSVVAIGGSTGGPAAIVEILRGLPPTFPIPILVVIHIGDPFGAAFAEWLDGLSPLRVRYAHDGEVLPSVGQAGIVMAPPGFHLALQRGRLKLTRDPERNSCRPSVDVLFESLAREIGSQTTACLLTGMGRDGAAGVPSPPPLPASTPPPP